MRQYTKFDCYVNGFNAKMHGKIRLIRACPEDKYSPELVQSVARMTRMGRKVNLRVIKGGKR